MFTKYGGKNKFYTLFREDMQFLKNIRIEDDEFFTTEKVAIIANMEGFKRLLTEAISLNITWDVYLDS